VSGFGSCFQTSGSGIRIRDEQPRSCFQELGNHFWVKILKYFDADPESGMEKFGSGMRKRRIRITENLNAIVKCAIISYAHLGQITFGDQDP
jgi:hypothetical protein